MSQSRSMNPPPVALDVSTCNVLSNTNGLLVAGGRNGAVYSHPAEIF